jgi:hypothetical protein
VPVQDFWRPQRGGIYLCGEQLGLEIQMTMVPTAGIKASLAYWTDRTALQVLTYCQFFAAGTAQNSFLVKLVAVPNLSRMASFSFMAMVTGIISLAAFEFDGDNIQPASVMGTAGMRVYFNAMNSNAMSDRRHNSLPQQRLLTPGTACPAIPFPVDAQCH